MRSLLLLVVVVGCTVAAPQFGGRRPAPPAYKPAPAAPGPAGKPILIVKQAQEVNYDGSFAYDFETENGIASQANGHLNNPGTENEALVISGSYSYTGDDGVPVLVVYTADENGYVAQSDAIPTAPPIPEAILKSLEYLRSLPPSKDDQRRK